MKVLLVVDPALNTPEASVYNTFQALVEETACWEHCEPLRVRFWLPALGEHRSWAEFLEQSDFEESDIGACVSLGSYAHLDQEQSHGFSWFAQFDQLLFSVLAPRKVPFLGICFAHQFLAARWGWKLGFVPDPQYAGMGKYDCEPRRVQVTAAQLHILLAEVSCDQWNRNSPEATQVRRAWAALRNGEISAAGLRQPLLPKERDFAAVLGRTPSSFWAYARHEQRVEAAPNAAGENPLMIAGVSGAHRYDALVHCDLPWFTVQTHPEKPLTLSSKLLLRNFLLMSRAEYPSLSTCFLTRN